MTKPLNGAIVWLTLLTCLSIGGTAAGGDHNYFTVPPYVFPGNPDLRDFQAAKPAGFCFAKTDNDRAFLIFSFGRSARRIEEIEAALDKLVKDLGLAAGAFDCPPQVLGRAVRELLAESGRELIPFVVPKDFMDARPQRPPADKSSPPKTKWPIVDYDEAYSAPTKDVQQEQTRLRTGRAGSQTYITPHPACPIMIACCSCNTS
jgi:hypothetical protein